MADRLTLEIATPMRLVVAETVDEVVAPGIAGYFGVLPGHAPFLTTLGIGEVTYRVGQDEHYLALAGGFAEVRNDKVIVLADTAERPGEIDRARAERARERAEPRARTPTPRPGVPAPAGARPRRRAPGRTREIRSRAPRRPARD